LKYFLGRDKNIFLIHKGLGYNILVDEVVGMLEALGSSPASNIPKSPSYIC
jgi:hypothetical protein